MAVPCDLFISHPFIYIRNISSIYLLDFHLKCIIMILTIIFFIIYLNKYTITGNMGCLSEFSHAEFYYSFGFLFVSFEAIVAIKILWYSHVGGHTFFLSYVQSNQKSIFQLNSIWQEMLQRTFTWHVPHENGDTNVSPFSTSLRVLSPKYPALRFILIRLLPRAS